jgi:hypothetical protein
MPTARAIVRIAQYLCGTGRPSKESVTEAESGPVGNVCGSIPVRESTSSEHLYVTLQPSTITQIKFYIEHRHPDRPWVSRDYREEQSRNAHRRDEKCAPNNLARIVIVTEC